MALTRIVVVSSLLLLELNCQQYVEALLRAFESEKSVQLFKAGATRPPSLLKAPPP